MYLCLCQGLFECASMWTYRDRLNVLILEFLEVPFVFRVSCVLLEMRLNLFGFHSNAPSGGNYIIEL